MGVAKLTINGVTRFDISGDTVASANLLTGYSAHDSEGEPVTGALEQTTSLTAAQILSAVQAGWN